MFPESLLEIKTDIIRRQFICKNLELYIIKCTDQSQMINSVKNYLNLFSDVNELLHTYFISYSS